MPSKKIEYNCTHCESLFIRGKSDIERTLKKNNTVFCTITCSKDYKNKIQLEKGFSENKTCKKCNIEKPRTNEYFTAHKRTLDGFDSWCKTCRGNYRSEIRSGQYRSMISDKELKELLTEYYFINRILPKIFYSSNFQKVLYMIFFKRNIKI